MLTDRIRQIHAESGGTYGRPRVHAALQAEGIRIGPKRVARLMKEAGLKGVSRRKRPSTTTREKAHGLFRTSSIAISPPPGPTSFRWLTSPTC